MPELPEVQTIINDLQVLTGDTITGFWTDWQRALKFENKKSLQKEFEKILKGKKINSIKRHGKYIIINLSKNISLVIHLRMTGQLLVRNQASGISSQENKYYKHIHHIFYLKKNCHPEFISGSRKSYETKLGIPDQVRSDSYMLSFSDIRKFGTITIGKSDTINFLISSAKGIDPFDKNFSFQTLAKIITGKKKSRIKDILMDQSQIAGIGNIYASEILFDAKIKPDRMGGSLAKKEILALYKSVGKILKKAIELRGTSFSDYRDSSGKKGGFQKVLSVYKKSGQECKRCGTIVQKTIIGQRSTFYCPHCQK